MKTRKMNYSILLLIILLFPFSSDACSMYKITKDGKTIVGNNEDWISPNSQLWYATGKKGEYGVMNVGMLNNFAQGAMNEAGLVFDGFANPYLEVKNVEGKANIPIGEVVKKAMHSFDNVRDVKKYFSTINLSSLASGQLVFVDKTGEYLIVEGDELIVGNESERTFSNFYYSQIESIEAVDLPNVQNGIAFLKKSSPETSFEYCGSVMKALSNPDDFTQYSTIYDLDKLTIRIYLYHDYTQFVEIDLREEIKKGNHNVMIAELFPENSLGRQHYLIYNDQDNPTRFIEGWIGAEERTEKELIESGFAYNINLIGYEWLYDKKNAEGAIKIFEFATKIMPNEANLFDSLGEAYLANSNYNDAIKSYANSLKLNPSNNNAFEMLERIRKERENQK